VSLDAPLELSIIAMRELRLPTAVWTKPLLLLSLAWFLACITAISLMRAAKASQRLAFSRSAASRKGSDFSCIVTLRITYLGLHPLLTVFFGFTSVR